MRPFGAIETCQLWKIFEVNTGCPRSLQQRIPRLIARCRSIFQRFESAANRKAHENNLTAAGTEFFRCCNCIVKAFFDRLFYFCHERVLRNVTWGRRRSEKGYPNLLNSFLQLTAGTRAFLDHAGSALPIQSSEIRRKTWRDQCTGPIWNGQTLQQILERQFFLFKKRDMFFQWHGEILAGPLRRSLRVKPADGFFPAFHRGCAGRSKK